MPPFWIETQRTEGPTLVAPHGDLDLKTVREVASSVRLAAAGGVGVTMDLRAVSFIGAQGVRLLLQLGRQATSEGWRLTVYNPSPRVRIPASRRP